METWAWDGQDWTRLPTTNGNSRELTMGDGKLVYLPKLHTTGLIFDHTEKSEDPNGKMVFSENFGVWILTDRYFTFLPSISILSDY
jgi:hypothetical protein